MCRCMLDHLERFECTCIKVSLKAVQSGNDIPGQRVCSDIMCLIFLILQICKEVGFDNQMNFKDNIAKVFLGSWIGDFKLSSKWCSLIQAEMSIGQAEIYNDIVSRRGGGRVPNPEVPQQLANMTPLSSKSSF